MGVTQSERDGEQRRYWWTPAEIRRAVALQARGLSHRLIAAAMGRHPRQVLRHLRRHGADPAALAGENRGRATSERQRAFCAGLGWAEVSVPTHARVLSLLATRGPLTHREIALALGWTLCGCSSPSLRHRLAVLRRLRYVTLSKGRPPRYAVAPWLLLRKGDTG